MASSWYVEAIRNALNQHSCEICGSTWRLQIHHIDGDHSNNKLSNLQVLCAKHHAEIHRNLIPKTFSKPKYLDDLYHLESNDIKRVLDEIFKAAKKTGTFRRGTVSRNLGISNKLVKKIIDVTTLIQRWGYFIEPRENGEYFVKKIKEIELFQSRPF